MASELCQTVGDKFFFTWHIFLEVGKTQDMPSKIWQTFGDALIALQVITYTASIILLTLSTLCIATLDATFCSDGTVPIYSIYFHAFLKL